MSEYTVIMTWDAEARVWYAACDDIPIALESGSFDALVERVKIAAPEMLQMNGANPECVLYFTAERRDGVA
jgi:predicted RNase H-like HicB family nuclease